MARTADEVEKEIDGLKAQMLNLIEDTKKARGEKDTAQVKELMAERDKLMRDLAELKAELEKTKRGGGAPVPADKVGSWEGGFWSDEEEGAA